MLRTSSLFLLVHYLWSRLGHVLFQGYKWPGSNDRMWVHRGLSGPLNVAGRKRKSCNKNDVLELIISFWFKGLSRIVLFLYPQCSFMVLRTLKIITQNRLLKREVIIPFFEPGCEIGSINAKFHTKQKKTQKIKFLMPPIGVWSFSMDHCNTDYKSDPDPRRYCLWFWLKFYSYYDSFASLNQP